MNLRGIVVMGSTCDVGVCGLKSNLSNFFIFLHFMFFKLAITFLREKVQTKNLLKILHISPEEAGISMNSKYSRVPKSHFI